ncbi:MAG: beta-glucanase [Chloroflexota bacterium]
MNHYRLRQIIPLLGLLALLLASRTATPAHAQAASCQVTYTANQWNTGFTADVKITNNTAAAIQGWTLTWTFANGQQVTGAWNATLSQSGAAVTASSPAGHWNGTIAANGGSVSFGFQATHLGTNTTPTDFAVNGIACNTPHEATHTPTSTRTVPVNTPTSTHTIPANTPTATTPLDTPTSTATSHTPGTCQVVYSANQWGNGFTAEIKITNHASTVISGWSLTWRYENGQQVTSAWNATLSQSGTEVTASNPASHWNGTIAAHGGSVSFGIQGTHTGVNLPPAGFALNGVACGGNPSATHTPTSTGPTDVPTHTNTPAITATHTPTPSATPTGGFYDDLNQYNTGMWTKADGWTNGDPFNAGWRADHISFANGIMTITLDNRTCPSGCSNRPYASGEYRRNVMTTHGLYEVRLKAAKGSGIVGGSFFVYTGPSDNQPWDEIDIEILGKDTTKMQTNYFTNGVGGHETMIDLGFDAADDFHTYGFEFRPGYIKWYVDGVLVHTETGTRGPLPTHPMKLMMNFWPGIGVDSWLGPFNYTGPLYQQVDWIRYTP